VNSDRAQLRATLERCFEVEIIVWPTRRRRRPLMESKQARRLLPQQQQQVAGTDCAMNWRAKVELMNNNGLAADGRSIYSRIRHGHTRSRVVLAAKFLAQMRI
jgi:hypothetical protein